MAPLFDWFLKPRASRRLYGDASKHWNALRATVHQEQTRHHLLEVVSLCQQSISANPRNGNPYVLLTNALLQSQMVFNTANQHTLDQYAAAVIKLWADLPFDSTTANNAQLGKRWYSQVKIRLERRVEVSDPASAMEGYSLEFGERLCSPEGLDDVLSALTGPVGAQPLPEDTVEQLQQGSFDEQINDIFMKLAHLPVLAAGELDKIPEVWSIVYGGANSQLSDGALWAVSSLYRAAAEETARELILSLSSRDNAEIILEVIRDWREGRELQGSLGLAKSFLEIEQVFGSLLNPKSPLYGAANCSAKAAVYQDIADLCLVLAYGIFPHHRAAKRDRDWTVKASPVSYGEAYFGLSQRKVDASELEFAEEVVWLYKEAKEGFLEALKLNPSDGNSYLRLSQVAQQLGQQTESDRLLSEALATLDKALQADDDTPQLYIERAKAFEALGLINEAIRDIRQALHMTKYADESGYLNKELERLTAKKNPEN